MIVLAGTIRIAEGMRAKALPHIHAMIAASRAEPGCVAYSFSFDVADENLVRIFECFADEAVLQAHRESAHMQAWRAAWAEAGIGERNMMSYVVSEAAPT